MKLTFITPASAHAGYNTARTVTASRGSGTIAFSAAFIREQPNATLATLAFDSEATDPANGWYALLDTAGPEAGQRELRGKKPKAGQHGSQSRYFNNKALAVAVLAAFRVPADRNSVQLHILPEPVKHEGLVLWPLRIGTEAVTPAPAKESVPAPAPTPTPAPEPVKKAVPTPAPVKAAPKLALPDFSEVELNPRRISNVYAAGLSTLKGRYRYLLAKSDMSGEEAKELAAVERRLRKELGY